MSKKKSKPGSLSQQVLQAQHRNRYFEKIKFICQACGAPQAFSLLPRPEIERMYRLRFLPFTIFPAPGEDIPEQVLKDCRSLIFDQVKRLTIPLVSNGPEMSLDDCLNVGMSLHGFLRKLGDEEFPEAAVLKQALSNFWGNDGLLDRCLEALNRSLWVASLYVSDLNSRIYWLTFEYGHIPGDTNIQRNLEIHSLAPERTQAVFDGITRPAVRACWAFCGSGLVKVDLKPSQLGVRGSFAELPHEVYVQSHALMRLAERMDGIEQGLLHGALFMSLQDPKAVNDGQGNILVEYRVFGAKAGYLRADIKDGRVVLRTFLFITNDGTPEGDKLREICGLRKLDKEFLALDRLSTFVASDFDKREKLKELFEEAGCGCLWETKDKLGPLCNASGQAAAAAMLEQYLGLKVGSSGTPQ